MKAKFKKGSICVVKKGEGYSDIPDGAEVEALDNSTYPLCLVVGAKEKVYGVFHEDSLDPVNTTAVGEDVRSALKTQVGGAHYSSMVIQPMEYCVKNGLNYGQSNVIKYVSRYKNKNGKQDLEKAIHCLQLLIELEY